MVGRPRDATPRHQPTHTFASSARRAHPHTPRLTSYFCRALNAPESQRTVIQRTRPTLRTRNSLGCPRVRRCCRHACHWRTAGKRRAQSTDVPSYLCHSNSASRSPHQLLRLRMSMLSGKYCALPAACQNNARAACSTLSPVAVPPSATRRAHEPPANMRGTGRELCTSRKAIVR